MKSTIVFAFVFVTVASGRILQCNYSSTTWPLLGAVYNCRANVIEGNTNLIEEIIGDHLNERSNEDVQGLQCTEQVLSTIPQNLASFFPNLRAVDFSNAQILTLVAADVSQLTNLAFFRVFNNRLTSIEGNLLSSNLHLQYVDFGRNLLETVGENLLGNLNALSAADFSGNTCIDMQVSSPAGIANLNKQLPLRCPPTAPTTTTESPMCEIPCAELEELKATIVQQARKIADLERRLGSS